MEEDERGTALTELRLVRNDCPRNARAFERIQSLRWIQFVFELLDDFRSAKSTAFFTGSKPITLSPFRTQPLISRDSAVAGTPIGCSGTSTPRS